MKGKILLALGMLLLLFAISEVSAYHPSNWDLANEYYEMQIPHNRGYDYFKYGSVWQGDVVIDVTYSDPPKTYPRRVAMPRNYMPHYYDFGYSDYNYGYNKKYSKNSYNKYRNYPVVKNDVHVHYHNPPLPKGIDASIVVGCGYEDGHYLPCY